MIESVYISPQLHLIGKISGAKNFESNNIFIKQSFKIGEDWKVISGNQSGETFQSISSPDKKYVPLEQPIDLHFSAHSIRGWPKLLVEVWEVDEEGRNSIGGYGQLTIPFKSGNHIIKIPCWRPKPSFFEKLTGSFPELLQKDAIISSESRFGLQTESTGTIIAEINVVWKDFDVHGIEI